MKLSYLPVIVSACCVRTVSAVHFDGTTQPDYLIVAARQRSGSTTLSSVIGGHPCAVSANELWTNDPNQDILGGHQFTTMKNDPEIRDNPREYLSQVHPHLCEQSRERGDIDSSCSSCTIVVKMFDIHCVTQSGIKELMSDESIRFVVLERNVHQEYCSLELAHQKGDWGTTPGQHKSNGGGVDFVCGDATPEFAAKHNEWFDYLRLELFNQGRLFMNVPFDAVASCNLKNVAASIFAFGGLETPVEFDYHDRNIESLFDHC
jgi:hypothetical protein